MFGRRPSWGPGHAVVRRHERIQLQGMEGPVLSRDDRAVRHVGLLRPEAARGRDQQHVLQDAPNPRAGELARCRAGRISLRNQGVASNHPPVAPQRRRCISGRARRDARGPTRLRSVPVAPVSPQERGTPGCIPRGVAAGTPGGIRVSPRLLVRRGDHGNAPATTARRFAFPTTATWRCRRSSRRRTGSISAYAGKRTTLRPSRNGTLVRTRPARGTDSRSSNTKMRGRDRSWPQPSSN